MMPFRLWRIPCLLAFSVALASHFPGPQLPGIQWFAPDKVAHFAIYGALASGVFGALVRQGWNLRPAALVAAAGTTLYGLLDEFHQAFRPFRTFELEDWAADAAGAAVACTLLLIWPAWRRFLLRRIGGEKAASSE